MIPTGSQIRSGRELLGISQDDLAIAANVGLALVIRAEMVAHLPQLTRKDSTAIQGVLEAGGVEFVQRDGGVGVQMRKADQP